MEELLKLVELVRQEAPQAKVKVDSLVVTHYFTMEELLNICNKYAEYKCALAGVVATEGKLCGSFEPGNITSSATICKHCGREKWYHPHN